MPSDDDTARRWRKLAAEVRRAASELTGHKERRVLLAIADKYEILASRAERRSPARSEKTAPRESKNRKA